MQQFELTKKPIISDGILSFLMRSPYFSALGLCHYRSESFFALVQAAY